jgi:hypothetical protein
VARYHAGEPGRGAVGAAVNRHAQSERPPVQQTLIDLGLPVTAILRRRIVHPRKGAKLEISPEGYQENLRQEKEPPCPF